MEITNILKARRQRLAHEISHRRGRLAAAERNLALVAKLEESIEQMIASVAGEPIELPPETSSRNDMDLIIGVVEAGPVAFAALDTLKRDLPEIRAYWETERKSALA